MSSRSGDRRPSARAPKPTVIGDRSHQPMIDGLETYLAGYTPRTSYDPEILTWARRLTLASRPSSRRDARVLCVRLCNLALWLVELGYDLADPTDALLADDVFEPYIRRTQTNLGTAATMRSAFRRVRRATTTERRVVFPSPRTEIDSAVQPATVAMVTAFSRWVREIDDQHTMHHDGLVLVSLIRGGGCTKADLDRLRVETFRPGPLNSLLIDVDGPVARTIAIDARWAGPLLAAQMRLTTGSPFDRDGQSRTGSSALGNLENYYHRQRRRLAPEHQAALPAFINISAYRSAWLIERLERRPRLDHLLTEAGLRSAAALDRYLQHLDATSKPRGTK